MTRMACHGAAIAATAAALVLPSAQASAQASARTCPAPLENARRLVLVTAETMNTSAARMQLFERASPQARWSALGPEEPAVVGRAGMAWSPFFRRFARTGEPVKVEGDKRAPAGVYTIGRSFGTLASRRPDHIRVTADTVCVDDPRSPAYNTIVSRRLVKRGTSVENMSRMVPMYRRGLVVNYPTDARARAGSCIFVHVWQSPTTATAGCVAVPEPRMAALQGFAQAGTAIAILPRTALSRLSGCLPRL